MDQVSYLQQALLFLSAAVISAPLFQYLGLGAVLGYLAAGMVIGPAGFKLVTDVNTIGHVSELGVIMLLFLIGLELKPARLWQMRRSIVGAGGGQVVASTIVIFALGYCLGLTSKTSLAFGMAFSLSSTAIALQVLNDRNLLNTPVGSFSFSTLLFQDMIVIPMLAILPLLSNALPIASNTPAWVGAIKIAGAIALFVIGGRYLMRPLFRLVASTRIREAFTATALLIVLGSALTMHLAGLSMSLGTFLAGVILAESEYRHELEVDIEPFKGLLLGLFFISVGMGIDLSLFLTKPLLILALVCVLVSFKIIAAFGIASFLDVETSQKITFALVLSQVGEFAFVLLGLCQSMDIANKDQVTIANAVVALSMLTTPLLMVLNDRIIQPYFLRSKKTPEEQIVGKTGGVIIAGFGRFGQIVGRVLLAQGYPITVLDHDPSQIELTRRFGYKVFYGDATRPDLLEAAGLDTARLLIVAVDGMDAANAIIRIAQKHRPNLPILARARNRTHALDLMEFGVAYHIRESFESAAMLSKKALEFLGFHPYRAHRAIQKFKEHDEEALTETLRLRGNDKALQSYAVEARQLLENIMRADAEDKDDLRVDSWS